MIVDGAATLKFVYLEGDMTLKDIQNIMMYQNTQLEWEQCEYTWQIELRQMKWGFPRFTGKELLINARVESVLEKRTFEKASGIADVSFRQRAFMNGTQRKRNINLRGWIRNRLLLWQDVFKGSKRRSVL